MNRQYDFDINSIDEWESQIEVHGNVYKVCLAHGLKRNGYYLFEKARATQAGKVDDDTNEYITKLEQEKQKHMDNNRVLRKHSRESYRCMTAIEELQAEVLKHLDKLPKVIAKPVVSEYPSKYVGVIQLSDIHFNEQVDFEFGQYNWEIASKRVRMHVHRCIRHFKANGIKDVLLAMTGDMFNSDRRLDEITLNATNRSKALVLGLHVMKQVLQEIVDEGFNLTVAHVCGNESRLGEDIHFTKQLVSDNFDSSLFYLLQEQCEGITFLENDNPLEHVVEVGKDRILLYHGHTGRGKDPSKKLQAMITKYTEKGVIITYTMSGHIHSALISELSARSGSPVGNNEYSSNALLCSGRPSQNMYIVDVVNGGVSGAVNLLGDVTNVEGYTLIDSLISYNTQPKAVRKPVSYFKVVI